MKNGLIMDYFQMADGDIYFLVGAKVFKMGKVVPEDHTYEENQPHLEGVSEVLKFIRVLLNDPYYMMKSDIVKWLMKQERLLLAVKEECDD